LRGDYLALVTLGFGEVVRFSMRNLTYITNGTKTINPIVSPFAGLPELTWNTPWGSTWSILSGKTYLYFFCLLCLAVAVFVLRNLERSRLGRAWVAIREDELAASCMGIDVTRVKLAAFACGATLAGLAGSLYALLQSNTSAPETYDFALSITMLACIILGGLGSMRGAMAGVLLLVGFDLILAPWVDEHLQQIVPAGRIGEILKLNNWRYMIFGLSLVLMMRLRPEGLLPSERVQREMHEADEEPAVGEAA
jgi:branched-chain amino acid transport system permease protein